MSGLAKVFVVLNLFLSLLFFGASATLFLVRDDLKAELNALEKSYGENELDLERAVREQKATLGLAQAAVEQLRNTESNLTVQLEESQRKVQTLEGEVINHQKAERQATASLEANSKALTAAQTRISELERSNSDLVQRRDEALALVEQSVGRASRLKRDLDQVNEELSNFKKEYTDLVNISDADKLRLEVYLKQFGPIDPALRPVPPLDARIHDVERELKAAVLTVGDNQKVQVGDVFTVYRGSDYIGQVKVVRTYGDQSGAMIIHEAEGRQIKPGDRATTRIGTLAAMK